MVGLNVTRALTCRFGAQLSAGRVQTPTLALIVARERAIKDFVPRDYWMVQADLGRFFVTWQDAKGQTGIFEKEKAERIAAAVKGREFRIVSVDAAEKSAPPPHALRSYRAAAGCQ